MSSSDHSPASSLRLDVGRTRRPHIFAFAPNGWNGPWMNRQQILSRFARRGWPITYSMGPLSSWERGSDTWRAAPWFSSYEMRDGVLVEIPGKTLPRWRRLGVYDRFVTRHRAAALLRHAGCAPSQAIAYVFHPSLYEIAAAMECRRLVYHAYDLFALQPSWTDALALAEEDILRRADLVIASSPAVAARFHQAGRDDTLVVPNGADAQAFEAGAQQRCPADLAEIPRPRIGYIGNLNRKVDFRTIARVAKERPDWHWVLVGPVPTSGSPSPESDPRIAAAFRECRTLTNVHFLGEKPHTDLPAYAGHMDVNTICYRSDKGWWNAAAPLKLHEYLATGHPVVSVGLPGLQDFADVVTFVSDTDDWQRALEAAMGDRPPQAAERRRRVARANSWDRRVDLLEQRLTAMTDQGRGRGDPAASAVLCEVAG